MYIDENGIHDVPIIDFVARKRGEWVDVQFRTIPLNRISKAKKCSICGKTKDKYVVWNFCPSCGSDMRDKP